MGRGSLDAGTYLFRDTSCTQCDLKKERILLYMENTYKYFMHIYIPSRKESLLELLMSHLIKYIFFNWHIQAHI